MSKPREPLEVDFYVLDFYDKVRGLLSDAGRYAHSYKLRENLNDEATRSKVECVFREYYDGNMRKLNDDIHYRRRQCFKSITEVSQLCKKLGLHEVKDKEVVVELLLDADRRGVWKKIIKRVCLKQNRVVSLQAIELEYRKKRLKKAP